MTITEGERIQLNNLPGFPAGFKLGDQLTRNSPSDAGPFNEPSVVLYASVGGSASATGGVDDPLTLDALLSTLNDIGHVNGDIFIYLFPGTYATTVVTYCNVVAKHIYLFPYLDAFTTTESLLFVSDDGLVSGKKTTRAFTYSPFTSFSEGDRFAFGTAYGNGYPTSFAAMLDCTSPQIVAATPYDIGADMSTAEFEVVMELASSLMFTQTPCHAFGIAFHGPQPNIVPTLFNVYPSACRFTDVGSCVWQLQMFADIDILCIGNIFDATQINAFSGNTPPQFLYSIQKRGDFRVLAGQGWYFGGVHRSQLRVGGTAGARAFVYANLLEVDFELLGGFPLSVMEGSALKLNGSVSCSTGTSWLRNYGGRVVVQGAVTLTVAVAGVPIVLEEGAFFDGVVGQPISNTSTPADVVTLGGSGNTTLVAGSDPVQFCRIS